MTLKRQRVAILGSTGSIGVQTLDVCRQHSDKLQVVALSAHRNVRALAEAAREFEVGSVVITDESLSSTVSQDRFPSGVCCRFGMRAAIDMCLSDEVDVVVVAIVGAAGLHATYELVSAGKVVALANKESLVVGGDLIMPLVKPGQLLPVDSEHSAIFQCYLGERHRETHAIWLTCSGGPFFGSTPAQLERVTVADALAHPTWNMGSKITIDSATLMNKGLERIEAMHLFNIELDRIRVLIQRQSKIHSMVEFADGSVMAHLGASDMRIPIQFALSYPDRWETPAPRVDFRTLGSLDFDAPDQDAFRCLALAEEAGKSGGTMPCVLNAANEVAVDAFLHERCSFTDIARIVDHALDAHDREAVTSLGQLDEVDAWARRISETYIFSLNR